MFLLLEGSLALAPLILPWSKTHGLRGDLGGSLIGVIISDFPGCQKVAFVCLFVVCLFPPFYKKRDLFSWHFPLDGSFKGLSGEETDCRGEKAAKCTKSTMKRGVVCFVKLIQF